MSNIQFSSIISEDGQKFITAFVNGKLLPPVDDSHPNFDQIASECANALDGLYVDPQTFEDLFDVSVKVAQRFEKLSERVSVAHGRVYFDGDEIDSSLTQQIIRFLDSDEDDWRPLVNFFEKVQSNPIDHSKEQLFDWLKLHDTITITPEGDLIGYKGVHSDGNGGYVSGFSGTAIVDGVRHTGKIPNAVGSTVEMPRSEVAHDPATACSYGLHVGTYDYARSYAQAAMLAVRINPRDVVSVPTDAGGAKVRVCRYKVEEVIDLPYSGPLHAFVFDEDEYEPAATDSFLMGDRVRDSDGDMGTVRRIADNGYIFVKYDNPDFTYTSWDPEDFTLAE